MRQTESAIDYLSCDSTTDKHTKVVRRICHYIHGHLDETICLENLAEAVYVSPFHLHRIFSRVQGETLKSYIRRLRLERSAYELKINDKPILDVALESGYQTNETYTRAFRQRFGINPSDFRQKHSLQSDVETGRTPPPSINLDDIRIKALNDMRVAYFRILGSYGKCPDPLMPNSPWQFLLKAFHLRNVSLDRPRFIGICHDDPAITEEDKIRFDAAVLVPEAIKGDNVISIGTIKAGAYIVAHHVGTVQQLYESYVYLLEQWIKNTPYRLRNEPPFEIYQNIHEGDKGGIDIYIPIIMG